MNIILTPFKSRLFMYHNQKCQLLDKLRKSTERTQVENIINLDIGGM